MGIMYFPKRIPDRRFYFSNLKTKIGQFQVTLGLTQPELDSVLEDCENYLYLTDFAFQIRKDLEGFYDFQEKMIEGVAGAMPEAPTFTSFAMPGPGAAGIIARQKAFKARVMLSPGYTSQIGEVLGMVPPAPVPPPDPMTMTPVITVTAEVDGKALLHCSKKTADSVRWEYLVPNTSGWSFLADTTRAKSVVQLPNSLVAQPQRVVIRARYIKNNQPIGEYSQNTTVVTNP